MQRFRMSADIWGGNNRSGYESKSNPSRGNAVVQMYSHTCYIQGLSYPSIARRCLEQATCIRWIIPDVAGLQLPSSGYQYIEPQLTLSFAGGIIGFNFHPRRSRNSNIISKRRGSVPRQKEEAM